MDEINIVEYGPRELIRMGDGIIPINQKVELIKELSQTGLRRIESVSFVHPRIDPQFGDADIVMKKLSKKPGIKYIGVTPTEIACRRAVVADVDEIVMLVAASDTFNKISRGYSSKKMINKILPSIINVALNEGKDIRAYILTAFGCPYEGQIALSKIEEIASRLDFMQVSEISLVDSTGMATPSSVKEVLLALLKMNLRSNLAVHFHDTRGLGLANVMAAFEVGIRTFDTSLGGLSKVPAGAPEHNVISWNIPTEDLVNMFESMGIKTGVDLDYLLTCVSMAKKITKKQLTGHILGAGPTYKIFEMPQDLKTQK